MYKYHTYLKPEDGEPAGGAQSDTNTDAAKTDSSTQQSAVTVDARSSADSGKKVDAGKTDQTDTKTYWPTDWRETVSKTDEKTLARLQRYASPEAAMSALIAAQNRIAAGELKPVLGKNSTPEQVAEYRVALGIPDAPDKYDLGKDMDIKAAEKPLLEQLFSAAHKTNQTPEQVKETIKAYREIQRHVSESVQLKDEEGRESASDALRVEWGPEYRRNLNLINGLLDGAGSQKLKDKMLDARLPDGTKFGNSPEVMKMLVGLALVQNPTGVIVPGGSGDPASGIREELEKIQKLRTTDRKAYNKDESKQARERELIAAAQKMKLMDDNGNWKK